jgi:hypothetical protein
MTPKSTNWLAHNRARPGRVMPTGRSAGHDGRPGWSARGEDAELGLYSMICGVSGIVTGIEARNSGKRLHSVMADTA